MSRKVPRCTNFHLFVGERVSFGFRISEETIPEHPSISPFPSNNIAAATPTKKTQVREVYKKVFSGSTILVFCALFVCLIALGLASLILGIINWILFLHHIHHLIQIDSPIIAPPKVLSSGVKLIMLIYK